MAETFDELNRRTQRREIIARQRMLQRKRRRILQIVAAGAIAAVCLLIVGVLVFRGVDSGPSSADTQPSTAAPTQPTTQPTAPPTTAPTQPSTAPTPMEPETVIQLAFGGDLNITDASIAAGEQGGRYDYTDVFMDAAGIFAAADAAFVNFEGIITGAPYGSQSASAPPEMLKALADAGVDMVQLANSYAIYGGLGGLSNTMNAVRSAGMEPLGVFANNQEYSQSQGFTLVNIRGIRVAIVAFTKGMDGMSLPAGAEHCVNLLYTDYSTTYQTVNTDGITAVLRAAQAQKPDVTIALVHWGSEYNDTISPTQETIAKLMLAEGVDAIVGTHSHRVQQISYDAAAGTVVAYSLGDLFGSATKDGTNYSIILQLEITRNNLTGETKITGCDYTGLYVLTPERDGETMRIVQIETAMALYEHDHIFKVSDKAYNNMKYAFQRIQARVEG